MLGTIALIIIIAIIFFMLGAAGMDGYKNKAAKPVIEQPPTKYTTYANQVINVAAMIYCNYNESKIIRPSGSAKPKQDRIGEALQESLNLVGAAYAYFDNVDSDNRGKLN